MKLFFLTTAAGKRLIGKGMAAHPDVRRVLRSGVLVIIAGSTNGYAAEEILASRHAAGGFSRRRFFRGVTPSPAWTTTEHGRLPDESEFPGDVVIDHGVWRKGKTIFDVVDSLRRGDVILKGANALDLAGRQAAVLIGDSKAGTIGAAMQAAAGRRVKLILPVGVEKRIPGSLADLAEKLNAPDAEGARLFPAAGEVFTELDAIALLTGATAEIAAAGGICGAEGGVWLAVSGGKKQMDAAGKLLKGVSLEPGFIL